MYTAACISRCWDTNIPTLHFTVGFLPPSHLPHDARFEERFFIAAKSTLSAFSKMRIMKDLYRSSMLLLLFVIIGVPTAAQNNLPAEVREMARKVMMPVVYKVPGMDRV